MRYKFRIKGHGSLTATHRTTLEFTKDNFLTKRGDCIVGIASDFELQKLKKFLSLDKVKITVTVNGLREVIIAIPNRRFSSNKEMVIRMSGFDSERTFAVKADKGSWNVNRVIVRMLSKENSGEVIISSF